MAKENLTDEKVIKVKKDVIKNIAIVFLAVLLILTFFSNSIMNKSLPEVATMYVESKSIQESIRGTGMVEIDDPYNVEIKETRTISSVAVKTGDEVEKDQVLFYLEDAESAELEEAQNALEDLIYKYTVGALSGDMSDSAYKNATTGHVLGMNTYEAQIEAAKNRVKTAQDLVDSITRQQTIADGQIIDTSESDIAQAKLELEKRQQELAVAEDNYAKIKAIVDGGDSELNLAKDQNDLAQQMLSTAEANYQERLLDVCKKMREVETDTFVKSIFEFYGDGTLRSVKDEDELKNWVTNKYSDRVKFFEEADAVKNAKSDVNEKADAYKNAQDKAAERLTANKNALSVAEAERSAAKKRVSDQEIWITTLTNNATANATSNDIAKKQLANELALKKADAELELAKAKEAQTQLLTDISKTLDLANQNSIIREQQDKVNKLKEKSTGATIVAPVSGTILSVSKVAGEEAKADEVLATIQVEGKASTLSIIVSNEQAKKVTVGDEATLQNAWNYDNVNVRLTRIANDSENPGKNKKLIFSVTGDVVNGQSLSISIGQKARDYEKVVPNSAVREDNKGKFILIIVEKGTPFGNRYVAKRVDVEVLASDDSNTAVSGDIDNWAYVITTSDKPLSSGTQVRLAD